MSDHFKNLNRTNLGGKGSAETLREAAVEAALALIAARAPAMTSSGQLEHEMSKLSRYADQIQEALKTE